MSKVLRLIARMTSEVLLLVELVALRGVATRGATQPFSFVPPALRAGSSPRDKRDPSQTGLLAE